MMNLLVHPTENNIEALYSAASMLFSVVIYFWPFVNLLNGLFWKLKLFSQQAKGGQQEWYRP